VTFWVRCAGSRAKSRQVAGGTLIELDKVIGESFQVLVDASPNTGNLNQAWPFLAYLTNNPDGYAGLGVRALPAMFREHMGNDETPLHVLQRVAAPVSVQQLVGRYWARMAYLDIGHKQAQDAFMANRARLNFANLTASGSGNYAVRPERRPRYFGANIVPLQSMGEVSVRITSSASFTAMLAVRASDGSVRYIDLVAGEGTANVAPDEEVSLVVVNTPDALIQYDPFQVGPEVTRGLDYRVQLSGATPAD